MVSEFLVLGTLVWVGGMKEAEGSWLAAPGFFGSFALESGTLSFVQWIVFLQAKSTPGLPPAMEFY